MKYERRTSAAQKTFLLTLRDGTLTLAELQHQLSVKERQFGRWMRNPYFRAELLAMLMECSRRRHVELELAANVAMEMLRKGVKGEIELRANEIYLCKTLVELARNARTARRREKSRRRLKKKLENKERPLCHPSVMAERSTLLAELKALE